jgi:NAD(P)-dependent dehydrogenase (short-subunit alcohol dehydrogenase family)
MDINGKVFIVTGAASGLGQGTAEMLAAAGGQVVVADMQEDAGRNVAHSVGGAFVKCDVTDEADVARAVRLACSMGRLMGVVNCAGIAPAHKTLGGAEPHPLALFSKTVAVNLVGTFNVIRLAAAAMSRNHRKRRASAGALSRPRQSQRTRVRSVRPPTAPPKEASSP